MPATITTADLADKVGTDARTLRKFLRADAKERGEGTPGKGSRYALPADARSIKALANRFSKWDEARKADKTPTEDNTLESDDDTDS